MERSLALNMSKFKFAPGLVPGGVAVKSQMFAGTNLLLPNFVLVFPTIHKRIQDLVKVSQEIFLAFCSHGVSCEQREPLSVQTLKVWYFFISIWIIPQGTFTQILK